MNAPRLRRDRAGFVPVYVVIMVVAILIILILAVSLPLLARPAQQPVVKSSPAPAGSIAWVDLEWTFMHRFIDNEGVGDWASTGVTVDVKDIELYAAHNIEVYKASLDAGYSWNYQGTYEVTMTVRVTDTLTHAEISRWDSGTIKFDGNQGAFGTLIVRTPTIFFFTPTTELYPYHVEAETHFTFNSIPSGYTETDLDSPSANLNVN